MRSLRRLQVDWDDRDGENRVYVANLRQNVPRPRDLGALEAGDRVVIYDQFHEAEAVLVRWGDALLAKIDGVVREKKSKTKTTLAEEQLTGIGFPPPLSPEAVALLKEVVQRLADGTSIPRGELTAQARGNGVSRIELARMLRLVEEDVVGDLAGFMGFSRLHHPFRVSVGSRVLSAWCAVDALAAPLLLGSPATIVSRCPVTDERITVKVSDESAFADPRDAYVSFKRAGILRKRLRSTSDVLTGICRDQWFFHDFEAMMSYPMHGLWFTPVQKAMADVRLVWGSLAARDRVSRARHPRDKR